VSRGARGVGLALAALGLACAGPSGPPPPARVSVEVFQGLVPGDLESWEPTTPVVVILDLTRSMAEATDAGAPRHVAARRAADRLVRGVAAERPVWLYAVGSGSTSECQPLHRGARSAPGDDRQAVRNEIASLRARGEGSLAAALEGVRSELEGADAVAGSRVVVFSDLGPECGRERDLCGAASRLLDAGARLDVVAIGARPAPACLTAPAAVAERPAPPPPRRRPPMFRVIQREPESLVVGCSEAGGIPVAVKPGPGAVVVDLDPPLRVEKIFDPSHHHRLQVLDFPSLDPPVRKWRWLDTPVSEPPSVGAGADWESEP